MSEKKSEKSANSIQVLSFINYFQNTLLDEQKILKLFLKVLWLILLAPARTSNIVLTRSSCEIHTNENKLIFRMILVNFINQVVVFFFLLIMHMCSTYLNLS